MDGGVPRCSSYEVSISQHIRFPRVCSHVTDINARNKILRAKLLQQGYRYHKLRKTSSKFYRRHNELVSKFNVGLNTFLCHDTSIPGHCLCSTFCTKPASYEYRNDSASHGAQLEPI